MTEQTITIQPEHQPALARLQHILEYLQAEQTRLQAEMAHVATQGQRAEAELRGLLLHAYGIAPTQPFTLDAEQGIITTSESEPVAMPEPEPATAAEPDADAEPTVTTA